MKNNFEITILIPEEDSKIIHEIEKINDTEVVQIDSNRYDGDIAFVPIIITAGTLIIRELSQIIRAYLQNRKQIKVIYKGINITCNSIEEFEQIMNKIYPEKKDGN